MKKLLTIFWLFSFQFSLFSQSSWQKTIGTADDDEAQWVIPSASGGFLICGSTGTLGSSEQKALLVKIDQDGTVLWQKKLDVNGVHSSFRKHIELPDGAIVCVGTATQNSSGDENALVVKFKPDGTAEWARSFGGNSQEIGFSAIWTQNSLVISGRTMSFGAGDLDLLLFKLKPDGSLVWAKAYGDQGNDWAGDVIEAVDGHLIAVGPTINYTAFGWHDILHLVIDQSGNLTSSLEYGREANDGINHISRLSDGSLLAQDAAWTSGNSRLDGWLVKMHDDGSQIWGKTYQKGFLNIHLNATEAPDGKLVCAYYDHVPLPSNTDAYLAKLDENGEILFSKTFGGNQQDLFRHAIPMPDGGILAVGFTRSFGNGGSDVFIVRTDGAGEVVGCCSSDGGLVSHDGSIGTDPISPSTSSSTAIKNLQSTVQDLQAATLPVCDQIAANFSLPDTLLCLNDCVTPLNETVQPGVSYTWSFPGGVPSSSAQVQPGPVCYPGSGDFTITLHASNAECTSDATATVHVFTASTFTVDTVKICPGDSVFLKSHWVKSPAVFIDTISGGGGCFGVKKTVVALKLPVLASFSLSDTLICLDECVQPVNLAIQPGAQYSWTFDGGSPTNSITAQPDTVCYTAAGDFNIQLHATNAECTAEATATVHVGGISSLEIDTVRICPGDSVLLKNNWVKAPATFTDTLAVSGGCLDLKTTVVALIPDLTATDSIGLCPGDSVFVAGRWVFGPTRFSETEIDPKGCVLIRNTIVFDKTSGCPLRCNIFWPNVFSPNDDGLNDFWFPLFSCPLENFTLKIFDRWGELVWQTDDPNAAGWDGIFRKRKMQDAVFAYYAEWDFVEVSGGAARRFFKKGNVTLVR